MGGRQAEGLAACFMTEGGSLQEEAACSRVYHACPQPSLPSGPPEREHAEAVAAHHRQAGHRQRLGAITLSEDEGAVLAAAAARVVGVLQLWDAWRGGCEGG